MATLPDCLQPLESIFRPFPEAAIAATIARKDECLPHLLHSLEWALEQLDAPEGLDDDYILHIYALYLLAQFRETQAFPLIVQLFRHPEHESATADLAADGLSRILASTCGDDIEPIQALIEDTTLDEWVRSAGIAALGVLIHTGLRTREEISSYFGDLFNGRLDREQPGYEWDSLLAVCTDFGMIEHLDSIRKCFREGLVDPSIEPLKRVEKRIARSERSFDRPNEYDLINDTVAEMQGWHCFQPGSENDDDDVADAGLGGLPFGPGKPAVRDQPKIGRNDQCPCGSGKKYKKCCGKLG